MLRSHVEVFISSHCTSTLNTEISYLNVKTGAFNILMREKCQRHQQTYKVTYYIVSISIFWFMSFKIYLACLQAPVPVAVNQMACSPPHLPPSQKIVFLILTYRIRVNSLK